MKRLLVFLSKTLGMTALNIRASRQVFLVSVASIAIVFVIFGLFLIVYVNLQTFLGSLSQGVELAVYLKDAVSEKDKREIEAFIQSRPEVAQSLYVSKEEAWADFKNSFSELPVSIEELDFNPLPESYHLRFKPLPDRLTVIQSLASGLSSKPGVESVDYGKEWIGRFEQFVLFARLFLLASGALLGLGLALIVSNTIKLSFHSRRDEVELMLLIGATHRYVRIPFLLEGVLAGLFGALAGLILLWGLHAFMEFQWGEALTRFTGGVEFLSWAYILPLLLAGSLAGGLGSLLCLRAFFRDGARL